MQNRHLPPLACRKPLSPNHFGLQAFSSGLTSPVPRRYLSRDAFQPLTHQALNHPALFHDLRVVAPLKVISSFSHPKGRRIYSTTSGSWPH